MSVNKFYQDNKAVGLEEFLKNYTCDINEFDEDGSFTALHLASATDDYEAIKILLKYNADVNSKNRHGETPLHLFLRYYHNHQFLIDENFEVDYEDFDFDLKSNILDTLIKHNADINSVDKHGSVPVDIACDLDEFWILKYLFKIGTDIIDDNGEICQATADERNEMVIIENRLKIDALIHWRDLNGYTLLHVAAGSDYYVTFEELLNLGADINSVCNDNKTALHYIKQRYISYAIFHWNNVSIYSVAREHVIKLKCAKLEISKTNVDLIYNDHEFSQKMAWLEQENGFHSIDISTIENKCMREIEYLRSIICGYVSLYNLLTDDIHDISKLILNEDLKKIMSSQIFRSEFRLYHNIILNRWNEAIFRRILLACAAKYSLDTIFCGLTPNILHEIFRYFSIKDLKVFISAFGDFNKLISNN